MNQLFYKNFVCRLLNTYVIEDIYLSICISFQCRQIFAYLETVNSTFIVKSQFQPRGQDCKNSNLPIKWWREILKASTKNKTAEGSDWLCKHQITGTADYIGTVRIIAIKGAYQAHTAWTIKLVSNLVLTALFT